MADLRLLPWQLRYRVGAHLVSEARRQLIRATHRHCRVEFRGPVRLGPGFSLDIPGPGTLIVGAGVDFRRGFVCEIVGDGRVVIGEGCTFTSHALLQCTTSIEIGDGCTFGQSVVIVDGRHHFRDPTTPVVSQGYEYRPIRIDDDVTVMSKCTISADIGRRAVVGSHSLVNRAVPAYTLAVGTPARAVEYFGPDEPPPGVPRSRPGAL